MAVDVVILNSAKGIFRGSGVKDDLCGKRSLFDPIDELRI